MAPGNDLLSLLIRAYGSADRAQAALYRALRHAALDELPTSPVALASFFRAHLRPLVEADLGPMVAAALSERVVGSVDGPEQDPPASSGNRPLARLAMGPVTHRQPQDARDGSSQDPEERPISEARRKTPCIMLVCVDPADEKAAGLDLSGFSVSVLRVRAPLPACERMRVTRPAVVIIGPTVSERDVEALTRVAREIGCRAIELGVYVAPAALHEALRRALARATGGTSVGGPR